LAGKRLNRRAPFESQVSSNKENTMLITIGPVIALIAGILILVMPRLLNYIVAIYLIAIGVIGLLGHVKF
jgi:hypothetical protein